MNEEAGRRLDLLGFRERHGLAAAADHGGVSIRTRYRWQAAYRQSRAEGPVPGSRRPHRTPKREWPAGGARRDPAAPGGAPEPGQAEDPSAALAVLRGAGSALPGASDHQAGRSAG